MTQPAVPIRKVTVRQSSYAFAWWPHPPYSTIHNPLTALHLPLMFHYWPVCVSGSHNQSVWEPYEFQMEGVRKKGTRARPCPGMWDIWGCVCVYSRHLFRPSLHVWACTHTHSHTHTHIHGRPSHYTAISDSVSQKHEGSQVQGALSPLVNNFSFCWCQWTYNAVTLCSPHWLYLSPCVAMTDVVEGWAHWLLYTLCGNVNRHAAKKIHI